MQLRIKKTRPKKKIELPEPEASEFHHDRSGVEEERITKTLTEIDKTLSALNNHTW
jgi:hypothetical protein